MASLIDKTDPPTSVGDVKRFAGDAIGTGFGALNLVLGLGLMLLALPLISRIPVVGNLIQDGLDLITGGQGSKQGSMNTEAMWGVN